MAMKGRMLMVDKYPRLNESLITSGKAQKESRWKGRLIYFFTFLLLIIIGFSYAYKIYTDNQTTYQQYVYQDWPATGTPSESDTQNHLILALDYAMIDGQQQENLMWAAIIQNDQADQAIIYFPMNMVIDLGSEKVSLNNYLTQGIADVAAKLSQVFDLPFYSINLLRLANLRPLLDELEGIELLDNSSLSDVMSQTYGPPGSHLSSLEFMQCITDHKLPRGELSVKQKDLSFQLLANILQAGRIFEMQDIIKASQFAIESNIPFQEILRITWQQRKLTTEYSDLTMELAARNIDLDEANNYQISREDWYDILQGLAISEP